MTAGPALDFTELVDLASARLGGRVLAANDEFFAPKENLLLPTEPVWKEGEYTDRGKWMDGWETRRRRTPGHDWCLIRLGLPGFVRGVVVDTSHFRGNFPEACSIEAASLDRDPPNEATHGDEFVDRRFVEILPRSVLAGHTRNAFAIGSGAAGDRPTTHLVLRIHPDGGVARLRVFGEVAPDFTALPVGEEVDLAAVQNGGRVIEASDMFFGHRHHLIYPGPPLGMFDGWETKRRRGPGHDWAIVRLAAAGTIRHMVVDTTHFKGNAPGWCSLDVCDEASWVQDDPRWVEILPRRPLQPHTEHLIAAELQAHQAVRYARLNIYPDGGVARLRLYGVPNRVAGEAGGGQRLGALDRLNGASPAAAERELLDCCGSRRWARAVCAARPFASASALHAAAEAAFAALTPKDWEEALAAHPKIGAAAAAGRQSARGEDWSAREQTGVASADTTVRAALADGNRRYEERFGRGYVVRASGRSAEEMLALLEARLALQPEEEFVAATREQREISLLRLDRMLEA